MAPTTYLQNYADIVIPTGATVTLDGQPLTGTPEPIGTSKWSLVREPLSGGQNGAHRLEANEKVGLQVLGFGSATSYSYPGGLDLKPISDAPTIVKVAGAATGQGAEVLTRRRRQKCRRPWHFRRVWPAGILEHSGASASEPSGP